MCMIFHGHGNVCEYINHYDFTAMIVRGIIFGIFALSMFKSLKRHVIIILTVKHCLLVTLKLLVKSRTVNNL